ncbi:RTTN-like protein, partial [Mya arenaria]
MGSTLRQDVDFNSLFKKLAGAETTVDTIATRHTQDYSLAPSTNAPSEHGARLPDYREPPLGFFEGCQGDLGQQPMTPGPGGHPTAADLGLDFSTTPTPFSTPSSSSSANQNGGGDGRPSVIGWTDSRPRGDGRDGDTSGSSTGTSRASSVGLSPEGRRGEPIDLEDVPALQYLQLTLPQFCTQVLERALPLLRSTDQSEKLIESLDVMADLLKFHHHSNLKSDPDDTNNDPGDLVQQRQCLIGLHVLLARILDPLVPLDKCRGVISENLLSIMNTLVYDEALSNTLPDLQLQLLGYLQYLDDGRYSVYVATATICQSLQRTCKFMNLAQEEASRLSKETLSLCEGAFDSLPYHRHMNYITETHYKDHKARYKKLLLQLLAHPIEKLRLGVFTAVLQCVKTNLSVLKASEPGSTSCEKVANAASELVTHLLKSQLLMSPALWQLMLKELARALPILQVRVSVGLFLREGVEVGDIMSKHWCDHCYHRLKKTVKNIDIKQTFSYNKVDFHSALSL